MAVLSAMKFEEASTVHEITNLAVPKVFLFLAIVPARKKMDYLRYTLCIYKEKKIFPCLSKDFALEFKYKQKGLIGNVCDEFVS